jgi:hypothetical protein
MTRLIVLAGGEATRWGNHLGVPKHLAPVPDGAGGTTPLLHRTITQARARGITDIHLIADPADDRYDIPGTTRHARVQAATGCPGWVRSIPLWHQTGRTIILHGDWWLSTAALDLILRADRSWWYACRIGPSAVTGVPYGEGAGTICWPEHHTEYAATIRRVDQLGTSGALARTGSWEIWAAMAGVPDPDLTAVLDDPWHLARRIDLPDDGSGDFDFPRDHNAWWQAYREGRINV